MANIFKLLMVALVIFMGDLLCADEPNCGQAQCTDQGLPNCSSRPLMQSRSVDIFGDALYWNTSEIAEWAITLQQNGNSETVTYKGVSFDWDPGFRVGVGTNIEHDQWDTQIYYTWFASHAADHIDIGSGDIESTFFGPVITKLGTFKTAQMSWKLHFNMFDWDLGRGFLVSQNLFFRPLIGVKWGWINQTIHTRWQKDFDFFGTPILLSANENLKNNFFGGGPKGGVHGKWILGSVQGHMFSLIGDFGASYMWGNWKIRDKFIDSLLTTVATTVGNRTFGSLILQAMMGIGWDFNFSNETSHFGMKLGYEIQDWIDQYQILDHPTGTNASDLILQGLTIDVRLDF